MTTKKKDAGALWSEVFQTLSSIDISGMITRKMNLDYLSWSRAWLLIQKHYPGTQRTYTDFPSPVDSNVLLGALIYPGGSAEVECRVDLLHPSGEVLSHVERLPVMDNKNKAILQPSTRDVSDTRQRCLVKALAMGFGLGLNLWSGDIVSVIFDEPTEAQSEKRAKDVDALVKSCALSKKAINDLYEKHKKKPLSSAPEDEFVAFCAWVKEQHPKGEKK
tara:strand:- start:4292 stop:4948 length:657 start_codon:yes stop_codon:yes gene_type:complete